MDPKLSNLDPNLKAAYDKVMSGPAVPPAGPNPVAPGVSVPPPPPVQQVSPPTIAPAPQPSFNQTPAPAASTPQTVIPSEPVIPTAAPSAAAPIPGGTIAFNANDAQKNQGTTTTVKRGGSKFKSIFLGIGILALLVGYTFVWIFVFKLKVPFLPKF